MVDKILLRKQFIEKRNSLSEEYRKRADKEIFKRLENFKRFKLAKKIFIYVGFGSEINTVLLIEKYIKEKRIFVPKIVKGKMELVEIFSVSDLSKGYFGVLEPRSEKYYYGSIDLVITPSVVFNKNGYRLGYGKGYYDKYFSSRDFKFSLGLAYENMLAENIPLEEHDKKVDMVITENRLINTHENFVVTTNIKTDDKIISRAKEIANYFEVDYAERKKLTLRQFLSKYNNAMLVYKDKILYVNQKEEKLFFHIDTAMLRIKNKSEPLLDIIGEKNQEILDITMGLARDSIVLSYFGHRVTSLEASKIIHFIVSCGLNNFSSGNLEIDKALRKIKTLNIDSLEFLKKCEDNSYDIVYADPMFSNNIKDSDNIAVFDKLACFDGIRAEVLAEMKRVARKKVIIKAHNLDAVFESFGLKKIIRSGSKFSFGYIDV
ncbi:5-formyltetrahydrofolate cyclo-ligase [Gemella sp. zg-1178]|uniref:5-formyltetrahydrofolate cyclo-ligase n=1 Tax=Gemella sp. zg-1178 TaxID=2840372 RepID=UPI001C05A796|nr:5-formyltetrahydrofolate cyclo-ligase [Gemella sp. zg-1178]MBU0279102.1 5-formyltetrahydrofolate cyclo-ligase [Gemella sp. zg-1178]